MTLFRAEAVWAAVYVAILTSDADYALDENPIFQTHEQLADPTPERMALAVDGANAAVAKLKEHLK